MVKHGDLVHVIWLESEHGRRYIKYIRNDDVTSAPDEDPHRLEAFRIAAYPNPFNSSVNLMLSGANGGDANVHIYDLAGRLVDVVKLDASGRAMWKPNVASGVYFVVPDLPEPARPVEILYTK